MCVCVAEAIGILTARMYICRWKSEEKSFSCNSRFLDWKWNETERLLLVVVVVSRSPAGNGGFMGFDESVVKDGLVAAVKVVSRLAFSIDFTLYSCVSVLLERRC